MTTQELSGTRITAVLIATLTTKNYRKGDRELGVVYRDQVKSLFQAKFELIKSQNSIRFCL